jgi:hypothetical protein
MVINNRLAAFAAFIGAALVFVGCASDAIAAPAPMRPGPSGSADGIDITIAAQDSTTIRPGGPPMRFNVALVNTTANDMGQIGMVVSLGHCACGPPGARMMPSGSMRMLDPNTNAWVDVPYDREGTGMDFIYGTLVPPFERKPGETVTYQLEMQINAEQNVTVGKGDGAVNVTRTDVTTHSAIGVFPTASLRISVEP